MKENSDKKEDVIEIPVGKYVNKLRNNLWIVSTFVLLIVLLVVLIFGSGAKVDVADPNETGEKIVAFLNSNPQITDEVDLVSVEKEESFYKATIAYQGQNIPVYLTLDGRYVLGGEPISLDGLSTGDSNTDGQVSRLDVSIDDDAVLGEETAPVTIIEFSDYQCPYCERFWSQTLPQIKEQYIDTGLVRFVYRDFPLSSIHPMAQKAAEAAECVREKGGDEAYYKIHDKLFENQATLSFDNMKKWTKELGYNIDVCLDSGKFEQEVLKDFADGDAAGVTGTPGFFINGIKVDGALPFEQFKQIIDSELSRA